MGTQPINTVLIVVRCVMKNYVDPSFWSVPGPIEDDRGLYPISNATTNEKIVKPFHDRNGGTIKLYWMPIWSWKQQQAIHDLTEQETFKFLFPRPIIGMTKD